MRVARIASSLALCLAAGCSGASSKSAPSGADYGSESEAVSKPVPTPIHASEHHRLLFDGTTKSYVLSFSGTAGQSVSIYADGGSGLDTVAYLYKVSRSTGRVYGSAIASNDDTSRANWTQNQYSSSIDSFVLPETRTYAMLVTTYDPSAHGAADAWFDFDVPTFNHPPPFAGSGAQEIRHFKDLDAKTLPVGAVVSQVATQSQGTLLFVLSRVSVAPADARAVLADPAKLGTFAFDVMYLANTSPPGPSGGGDPPASAIEIAWADAVSTLQSATQAAESLTPNQVQAEQILVQSMLGDGNFATNRVRVFKTSWNNGDDTNSDGILAVDTTTGEVRAVTLVNPP